MSKHKNDSPQTRANDLAARIALPPLLRAAAGLPAAW